MKMSKMLAAVPVAALAAGMLAACGSSGDSKSGTTPATAAAKPAASPASAVKGMTFGLDYGLTNTPLYQSVLRPAQGRAKELGITLKTTNSDSVCDKQITNLDNLVNSGVKAITYLGMCGKGEAYAPVIRRAHAKNIKIVSYGYTDPDADGSINFDNKQGAELLAADVTKWIRQTFNGDYAKFTWALLPCSFAPPTIQLRTKITKAAIVKLTGKQPMTKDCAADPNTAKAATDNFMAKAPQLNVVIGFIDSAALGAVQAFKDHAGVDRSKVYVGSMDGQREAVKLIAEGGAGGIYHATAALDLARDGRAVVDVPANTITGNGATSELLRYTLISVNDRKAAQDWYQRVFARYGG